MSATKVDLLHSDICEADVMRISDEAKERLKRQSESSSLISLAFLKFAFATRRRIPTPEKQTGQNDDI